MKPDVAKRARRSTGVSVALAVLVLTLAGVAVFMGVRILSRIGPVAGQPRAQALENLVTARPPVSLPQTPTVGFDTIAGFSPEQIQNAATIIAVAKVKFPTPDAQRRAAIVAVATAGQESSLRNLRAGDRDSLGLFQQRPSEGWGTAQQIEDPVFASSAFLDRLAAVPEWESIPVPVAAQTVQVSAYPSLYTHWVAPASSLVDDLF
ncbi:hypothetical protein IT072_03455 [Leifsonia sp. ZF2019]|uniref:hypothetical protein n=1 Tax=Leifsonia sp. ZF2019 TaxID=2781978 RepID=UPI001CBDBAD3|nr:hypothetical protein [Leifsonia sp. ZF2019]UAJ80120.1 hypothetical protein IT072_03455 [Leifsonia sp. ZF2019]